MYHQYSKETEGKFDTHVLESMIKSTCLELVRFSKDRQKLDVLKHEIKLKNPGAEYRNLPEFKELKVKEKMCREQIRRATKTIDKLNESVNSLVKLRQEREQQEAPPLPPKGAPVVHKPNPFL